MCDIQGNLQDGSQVVVSVIFENKCESFLKSMEFNVLDSLNAKLQRPEGAGPHDGLTVPFQLPPGKRSYFGRENVVWLPWLPASCVNGAALPLSQGSRTRRGSSSPSRASSCPRN